MGRVGRDKVLKTLPPNPGLPQKMARELNQWLFISPGFQFGDVHLSLANTARGSSKTLGRRSQCCPEAKLSSY